jgi:hypothetical protein
MPTCSLPEMPCVTDPALFHVADGAPGVAGIVSFGLGDCSTIVARTGQFSFGCPGDTLTASQFGAPEGSAGVAGSLPISVRFTEPQSVFVGSGGDPVRYLSADSPGGVAATTATAGAWAAGSSLSLTVGPAVGLLAALALGVALAVRWIRSVRSTV